MANEVIVNNSGQGENVIAPEIVANKFNWGAFCLTWIWGLGNNTYITLLILPTIIAAFIPLVNLIAGIVQLGLAIWFGTKGNEWAWKNKKFVSIEAFHSYQRKWAIAGIIFSLLYTLLVVTIFAIVAATLSSINIE